MARWPLVLISSAIRQRENYREENKFSRDSMTADHRNRALETARVQSSQITYQFRDFPRLSAIVSPSNDRVILEIIRIAHGTGISLAKFVLGENDGIFLVRICLNWHNEEEARALSPSIAVYQ